MSEGDGEQKPGEAAATDGFTLDDAEWAVVRERLPYTVYIFDLQKQEIRYANSRIAEVLGYATEQSTSLARGFLTIMHPEDIQRLAELYSRFDRLADDQVLETEYRLRHADGRYRWFLSVDRIHERDEQGRVKSILGTTAEISARKATEQDRSRMASLEAMGRLAGGIAHDFNNLLTVVLSNVRLARRASRLGEPPDRELDEIELVAREAAALTRQLLVVASRDPNQEEASGQTCDPVEVVRDMAPILRRLIEENVEIVYDFDPRAPLCSFARGSLVQIVLNLAVNARDAMLAGGTLSITVKAGDMEADARQDSWVTLRVADTGDGMTPEVLDRIFDPFFSTKEPERGTGLGLATVDQLVRGGGGRVTVCSRPGGGTAFSIVLPAEGPARSARTPPASVRSLEGVTILLCEDNELVRRVTKAVLEESGCNIVDVADGEEGVRALEAPGARFDLVLSDVVMPKKSGFEVAAAVRELMPNVPVLLWSGYPLPVDGNLAARAPAGVRILQKPVEPADLNLAIRELIQAARTAP